MLLLPTLSNRPSEFHACSAEACVGVEGYKGFEDEDRKQEVLWEATHADIVSLEQEIARPGMAGWLS